MASQSSNLCEQCLKLKAQTICVGCHCNLCNKCYRGHRQVLDQQFEEITTECDRVRNEFEVAFRSRTSLQLLKSKIDELELNLIEKVNFAAQDARKKLEQIFNETEEDISRNFKQLSTTLRKMREDEDYVETDLANAQAKLQSFSNDLEKLNKLSHHIIINNKSDQIRWDQIISIDVEKSTTLNSTELLNIPQNAAWLATGVTLINGLKNPYSLTIDHNSGIVFVADTHNNQIVSWNPKTKEKISVKGDLKMPSDVLMDYQNNSLLIADNGNRRVVRMRLPLQEITSEPEIMVDNIDCWGLARDKDGTLYVTNALKHEVRQFEKGDRIGRTVAGGNGSGSSLNQLNWPRYIVVDDEYSVYVSDWNNHRVVKWTKGATSGILVAGGCGSGSNPNQLTSPAGIAIDSNKTLYIVEESNFRVTRWREGEKTGNLIVGGNGHGSESNQLSGPFGLCFDKELNLYTVEYSNQRVQRFSIQQSSSKI